MLAYNQHAGQWSGSNEPFSIWMNNATFRASVAAWYDYPTWFADCASEERRTKAIAQGQRIRYWSGCERNSDRRVYITYHSPVVFGELDYSTTKRGRN